MGVIDWNQGILINLIEIYMQRYVSHAVIIFFFITVWSIVPNDFQNEFDFELWKPSFKIYVMRLITGPF